MSSSPQTVPTARGSADSLSALRALVVAWFGLMASTPFWVPAYHGDLGDEFPFPVVVYAIVAGVAALALRATSAGVRRAVIASVPALAVLAAAGMAGVALNAHRRALRGEPLYLYFGVALFVSWAALVVLSALVGRTRWSGPVGLALTLFVALFAFSALTVRVD